MKPDADAGATREESTTAAARGEAGEGMTKTLFDLVTGDRARVERVRPGEHPGLRQRLMDMGIMKGVELDVVRHAPLGDPVEVSVKGYYLALRMSEARQIDVEQI